MVNQLRMLEARRDSGEGDTSVLNDALAGFDAVKGTEG